MDNIVIFVTIVFAVLFLSGCEEMRSAPKVNNTPPMGTADSNGGTSIPMEIVDN